MNIYTTFLQHEFFLKFTDILTSSIFGVMLVDRSSKFHD